MYIKNYDLLKISSFWVYRNLRLFSICKTKIKTQTPRKNLMLHLVEYRDSNKLILF